MTGKFPMKRYFGYSGLTKYKDRKIMGTRIFQNLCRETCQLSWLSGLIKKANKAKLDDAVFYSGVSEFLDELKNGLETKVGNNCLIMIGAHIAHDCILGDNIILANNASLAGHVQVDDFAILGGLSGVHQFVRIGSHAMVGGLSALESDVIPYGSVIGNRAYLSGLNIIGLKRRGFTREVIHDLRKAYRLLFAPEGTIQERIKDVSDEFKNNEPVMDIVKFIEGSASRAICQPKNGNKNT